jgi:hypothetical protein
MRLVTVLTILGLSIGPSLAGEYSKDTYETYGFGTAASVFGLGMKAGLRGAHVASGHHQENSYYPGYTVSHPDQVAVKIN